MEEEFVIVGDSKKFKGCLITTCGTKQRAEEVLERMLTAPTRNDKLLIGDCTNLRIKGCDPKKSWWNDSVLAN